MSYIEILKSTYNLVTKGKTFFDSNILICYTDIFFHYPQPFLHFTHSIFNIFETTKFSNVNKKDGSSFSLMLYFGYFYYLYLHYYPYYLFFSFKYFHRSFTRHNYACCSTKFHIIILSK